MQWFVPCSENKSSEECLIKIWSYWTAWVSWVLLTQAVQSTVKILREEEKSRFWNSHLIAFSHPSSHRERLKFVLYKRAGCEISRCSERCISVLHNEIWWVGMLFKGYFLPLNNKCCHRLFLSSLWIMSLSRQWGSGYKCAFKSSNSQVIPSKPWPPAMA